MSHIRRLGVEDVDWPCAKCRAKREGDVATWCSHCTNVEITPYKQDPSIIDEVVSDGNLVHIERMDRILYWMRIGDKVFYWEMRSGKDDASPYIALIDPGNPAHAG